ncbi:hypothetical protein RFI_15070 [Reticulomyxa filosa]|uniref:Uncharacterized protein n=1 Tax=Reticulomyxa filosa TaxID=46433 RepID=X6N891_RETFI|nr:hypothetical protein RFI_15070 [Reticulomyxa filosa]|eukprot:ETO22133.1 hypothetical protein RFI_15070 [Reticulomyxa filosa]
MWKKKNMHYLTFFFFVAVKCKQEAPKRPPTKLSRFYLSFFTRAQEYYIFYVPIIASILYYFPATGYLFYRSPIVFGLTQFLGALASLLIPIGVIGKKKGIAGTLFLGKSHIDPRLALLIVCATVLAVYLSISGFSCTYFKYKKVIVRSQAQYTGKKKGKMFKNTI